MVVLCGRGEWGGAVVSGESRGGGGWGGGVEGGGGGRKTGGGDGAGRGEWGGVKACVPVWQIYIRCNKQNMMLWATELEFQQEKVASLTSRKLW
ncbi:unnamed protein product [Dicrocoelium dendriticum]|nr:unnamed protein product [Dicrocoelium dendriticum]